MSTSERRVQEVVIKYSTKGAQQAQSRMQRLSSAVQKHKGNIQQASATLSSVWSSLFASSEELNSQKKEIDKSFGRMAKSIAKSLVPAFKVMAKVMSTVADHFTNLPGPVKAGIGVVLMLVSAIVMAAQVVVALSGLVAGISSALTVLSAAASVAAGAIGTLTALVSSFLVPLLAVVAVVALLYAAWKTNLFGIRDVAKQVFAAITDAIKALVAFVKPFWEDFASNVMEGNWKEALKAVLAFTRAVAAKLLKAFVRFSLRIGAEIHKLKARIITGFELAWDTALNATKKAVNSIVGVVESLVNNVIGAFNDILDAIENTINGAIEMANQELGVNFDLVDVGRLEEVSLGKPFETEDQSKIRQRAAERLQRRLGDIERRRRRKQKQLFRAIDEMLGTGTSGKDRSTPKSSTSSSGDGGQRNDVTIERMEVKTSGRGPTTRRDSRKMADDVSQAFGDKLARR